MPSCRVCGCDLIAGENWWPSHAAKGGNICRSCGAARTAAYARTLVGRWGSMCKHGRQSGVGCSITLEEYTVLAAQPCVYCGDQLSPASYSMDQKVAGAGYTAENATPCCARCNWIKGKYFTYEQMLILGPIARAIYEGAYE